MAGKDINDLDKLRAIRLFDRLHPTYEADHRLLERQCEKPPHMPNALDVLSSMTGQHYNVCFSTLKRCRHHLWSFYAASRKPSSAVETSLTVWGWRFLGRSGELERDPLTEGECERVAASLVRVMVMDRDYDHWLDILRSDGVFITMDHIRRVPKYPWS